MFVFPCGLKNKITMEMHILNDHYFRKYKHFKINNFTDFINLSFQ